MRGYSGPRLLPVVTPPSDPPRAKPITRRTALSRRDAMTAEARVAASAEIARRTNGLPAIDAFVVPGLAFDRAGGRVGWGRGHYDATLAAARPDALRIGIAFECQVIDHVPHDPHDALLHYVVTERDVYEMSR